MSRLVPESELSITRRDAAVSARVKATRSAARCAASSTLALAISRREASVAPGRAHQRVADLDLRHATSVDGRSPPRPTKRSSTITEDPTAEAVAPSAEIRARIRARPLDRANTAERGHHRGIAMHRESSAVDDPRREAACRSGARW